jgi:hypothetical protein
MNTPWSESSVRSAPIAISSRPSPSTSPQVASEVPIAVPQPSEYRSKERRQRAAGKPHDRDVQARQPRPRTGVCRDRDVEPGLAIELADGELSPQRPSVTPTFDRRELASVAQRHDGDATLELTDA